MKSKQKQPIISTNESCIVRPCTCTNEGQDELYGKGNRLWNHASGKGSKPKRYRCTVCNITQEF